MTNRNSYLPDADWAGFSVDEAVPADFRQKLSDTSAASSALVRSPARMPLVGAIRSAQRRVTAAFGWAVLKVTKSPNVCQARGHVIYAKPWVEVPGHFENWFRVVGCECGKIAHIQTASHHQDPSLSFLPPKQEGGE